MPRALELSLSLSLVLDPELALALAIGVILAVLSESTTVVESKLDNASEFPNNVNTPSLPPPLITVGCTLEEEEGASEVVVVSAVVLETELDWSFPVDKFGLPNKVKTLSPETVTGVDLDLDLALVVVVVVGAVSVPNKLLLLAIEVVGAIGFEVVVVVDVLDGVVTWPNVVRPTPNNPWYQGAAEEEEEEEEDVEIGVNPCTSVPAAVAATAAGWDLEGVPNNWYQNVFSVVVPTVSLICNPRTIGIETIINVDTFMIFE